MLAFPESCSSSSLFTLFNQGTVFLMITHSLFPIRTSLSRSRLRFNAPLEYPLVLRNPVDPTLYSSPSSLTHEIFSCYIFCLSEGCHHLPSCSSKKTESFLSPPSRRPAFSTSLLSFNSTHISLSLSPRGA